LEFFTSQGFVVYGTSRNPTVLNSIFPLVTLDVRNSDSIQAAVAIIASSGRLDMLSIMELVTGPLEEIPSEEIKTTLRLTSSDLLK
jgi:hypothetical protein